MPQALITPSFNQGNIIVGFANLYTAPTGTTTPAATKALGSAWPDGWTNPGGTSEGVTWTRDPKTNDIEIEESATPQFVTMDTVDISFNCTLSEDTIANMLLAFGAGSLAATAATSENPGYSTLTLSDQINEIMVGFEAANSVSGCARIVVIPLAVCTAKVDAAYRRAKSPRMYGFTARAVCAQADILIYEQTALAS